MSYICICFKMIKPTQCIYLLYECLEQYFESVLPRILHTHNMHACTSPLYYLYYLFTLVMISSNNTLVVVYAIEFHIKNVYQFTNYIFINPSNYIIVLEYNIYIYIYIFIYFILKYFIDYKITWWLWAS